MKSISPILAIVILLVMTVGAAGMAYMTIVTYQGEVSESATAGTEQVSSAGKTQIKVESVSEGKIYVRNLGSEPLEKISVFVEGKPVVVSGPSTCEPGKVCVFNMGEDIECPSGSCTVKVETKYGSSTPVKVEKEEVEPVPPQYSDWNLNTTNFLFGECFLANVTWKSESSTCHLTGSYYWFSNYTLVTEEVDEVGWGRWD